jgi:hypothetical protein
MVRSIRLWISLGHGSNPWQKRTHSWHSWILDSLDDHWHFTLKRNHPCPNQFGDTGCWIQQGKSMSSLTPVRPVREWSPEFVASVQGPVVVAPVGSLSLLVRTTIFTEAAITPLLLIRRNVKDTNDQNFHSAVQIRLLLPLLSSKSPKLHSAHFQATTSTGNSTSSNTFLFLDSHIVQ